MSQFSQLLKIPIKLFNPYTKKKSPLVIYIKKLRMKLSLLVSFLFYLQVLTMINDSMSTFKKTKNPIRKYYML